MSEVAWLVKRTKLYELWQQDPKRKRADLAHEVGFSTSWVDKWLKRFAEAEPEADDVSIFFSQSRARHTSSQKVKPAVEEAILDIRDQPPQNLGRVPGPKAILYFLGQREDFAYSSETDHQFRAMPITQTG